MHSSRITCMLAAIVAATPWLAAQQSPTPQSLLAGAVTSLGGANVPSLAVTGWADSIAGATDDSGGFTATCSTSGASQLTLQLANSPSSESRQSVNGLPTGSWTDSGGQQHTIAPHNLLTPASWFCPVIALSEIISAANLDVQFLGLENKNGLNANHFVVNLHTSDSSQPDPRVHLSQVDIYLDPQTLQPLVFDFTTHPDDNWSVDIPIEIQFSNYQQVSGVWIPFTVQRYMNSSLALTLQVQSANTTSGQ